MPTSSKKSKTKTFIATQKKRYAAFIERQPHRSFQLSRRRDYARPIELPGYFSLTHSVSTTLWKYKKIFLLLALVYAVLYSILVGIQSQDTYTTLSETLKSTSQQVFEGDLNSLGEAGLLFVTMASTTATTDFTETQQIFSVLVFLLTWLTTVWLLRNILAGHKVKLRDGLYNSGSPLFAMAIIVFYIAIQLIPVAIALVGYSAASTSGLIEAGGAAAMLFWIGAALLCILSLYWITSSIFAMIIVTVPGMYPFKAIRTASDMVLGRRIKILLRWLWMALVVVLAWGLIMIPIILLDMGLKSLWPAIQWLPIVPIATIAMASLSTVWVSAYVYLLYRKVVDYAQKS